MLHEQKNELEEWQNEKQEGKNVTQQLQEVLASPKTFEKDFLELQEPSPQPSLRSYYKFIEGGRIIPQKFVVTLFYELEVEIGRTHKGM